MKRRVPPLRGLEAFEAIARTGSVAGAADELALTASAISHRLRALEDHLGLRLFHRAARRVVLTDAGRDYLQSVASAFERIERSTDRLASGMASDLLTVHCPPSFAPAWLLPRLPRFMARHPDIDLRIHASPEPVDFFRTDTDVEIRYGNADWAGLVVAPLLEDRLAPLVAPEVLGARAARPPTDRLAGLPLIVSERAPLGWEDWARHSGVPVMQRRGLRFDRGYLALQAARAGLGVALESLVFAEADLARGRLAKAFPELPDLVQSAHTIVYPPAFRDVPKIIAFRDWAIAEAKGSGPVVAAP